MQPLGLGVCHNTATRKPCKPTIIKKQQERIYRRLNSSTGVRYGWVNYEKWHPKQQRQNADVYELFTQGNNSSPATTRKAFPSLMHVSCAFHRTLSGDDDHVRLGKTKTTQKCRGNNFSHQRRPCT